MPCIDPNALIIFPDPEFKSRSSVVSVTSEAGPTLGPVVPGPDNYGRMVPSQQGSPSETAGDVEMMLKNSGETDDAEWLWRNDGESDEQWRGTDDPRRFWGYFTPLQTSGNEDLAAVYASKFNRIVLISREEIRYRDLDGDYDVYSSATWSIEFDQANDDLSGFGFNLDATELEDGTLLMCVLIENFDSAAGTSAPLLDFDLYRSDDGGLTWSRVLCRLLRKFGDKTTALAYNEPDPTSKFRLTCSGGWLRLTFITTQGTAVTEEFHTLVSNDDGSTWSELTSIDGDPFTNQVAADAYPHDVVGYGDSAGTFYMEMQFDASTTIAFRSSGFGDWVQILGAGYGVVGDLYSVGMVRHLGYLVMWYWDQNEGGGSNDSGWTMRRVKIGEEGVAALNYEAAHQQTHVARHRQQAPNLISAGPHIVCWAISQDAEDDILEVAPVLTMQGNWTQRSYGLPGQGWASQMYQNQIGSVEAHWGVVMGTPAPIGDPVASSFTEWTEVIGGGSTQSWKANALSLTGGGTGSSLYFEWSEAPDGTLDGWANYAGAGSTIYAVARMRSGHSIALTGTETGFSVISSLSTAAMAPQIHCIVRIAHDELGIYDQKAGSLLWSQTFAADTFAIYHEFRLVLSTNLLGDIAARLMWRPMSQWGGDWEEGTLTSSLMQVATATVVNTLAFGQLGQTAASASLQSDWREVGVVKGDAKYRLGVSENPVALTGMPAIPSPMYVQGGRSIAWGGASGQKGDAFTAEIEHAHPIESIFHPSPRVYWEGSSVAAQELIFDAGGAHRWQLTDIALIGTTDRAAIVDFATDVAFSVPNGITNLFADLHYFPSSPPTVAAFSGDQLQWDPIGTGNDPMNPESNLAGKYLQFASGALSGETFLIRKAVGSRRVHLDTGGATLGFLGVVVGDKFLIYGSQMVAPIPDTFSQFRYMRIRFSDAAPAFGVHRLGAIVAGTSLRLNVPLDWAQTDSEQPNITSYQTRSAVQWSYTEGPPQRTFIGRIVGDANLQNLEYRDRLRDLAGYQDRPVVLILDTEDYTIGSPTPNVFPYSCYRTMIYGRVTSGSQLERAAWYLSTENDVDIHRQAGDVSLVVTEEV